MHVKVVGVKMACGVKVHVYVLFQNPVCGLLCLLRLHGITMCG